MREFSFERILALTRDILRVADLEPALETIAHAVADLYEFKYVTIVAADVSGGDMVRRVMLGWSDDVVAARKNERVVRADILALLDAKFEVVENGYLIPAEDELPWDQSIYAGDAPREAPRAEPGSWHERDTLVFVLPDHRGEMLAYISPDGPRDGKIPSQETLESMQLFLNLVGLAVANAHARAAEIQRRELLEASQASLRHEATHDALTGLPNRTFFAERLATTLECIRASSPGRHAVLFIDLDEFKAINDSLGHLAGDRMLIAIAARMQSAIGPHDFVARFGGDEFAVLCHGRAHDDDIARVANDIHAALMAPIEIDGQAIYNTASIGIAMIDPKVESIDEVLRNADTAMYHAKSLGRARHEFFDDHMLEKARRRLTLMNDLRAALARDEFVVAYQPIVGIEACNIVGFEALVRWRNPAVGEIQPGEFLPLAEETGLIVPIGRFVLAQACETLARMRRIATAGHLRMHVNLSVQEVLEPEIAAYVGETLRSHELAPSDLTIELTESAIMRSGKAANLAFERLRATGVRLCIDDFGTGYSSLRYLHQFPVNAMKIDRSFVSSEDGDLGSAPIVQMIIALANMYGIDVVAEGVETARQARALVNLGCSFAQGYYFSRPVDAETALSLVSDAAAIAV